MKNLNALSLLQDIYTSDDEGCEHEDEKGDSASSEKPKVPESSELPVPDSLLNFLTDLNDDSEVRDNQEQHDGRVRSFPHERGNWASCLYVPVRNVEFVEALCDKLLPSIQAIGDFHRCCDLHVSFSRTVVLRHHWIPLFVEDVRKKMRKCKSFIMDFDDLEVLVNDERTRTFLALKVQFGYDMMLQLVQCADKSLSEFKLPSYYEDPSFHASILWCIGDKKKHLEAIKSTLQKQFDELKTLRPHSWSENVNEIHCKIGNRLYKFQLGNLTN